MVNKATRKVIVNLPIKLGITMNVKTGSKTDVAMAAAKAENIDCLFSFAAALATGSLGGASSGADDREETSDDDSSDEGDSEG